MMSSTSTPVSSFVGPDEGCRLSTLCRLHASRQLLDAQAAGSINLRGAYTIDVPVPADGPAELARVSRLPADAGDVPSA